MRKIEGRAAFLDRCKKRAKKKREGVLIEKEFKKALKQTQKRKSQKAFWLFEASKYSVSLKKKEAKLKRVC
jgi:hypothetical protein